jgi:Flp pilus assembly protein TadG
MSHDQLGLSMAPFMAAIVLSLLLLIGLIVDGGAQATAARRAERVAAAAARAAVDQTAAARLAGQTPDYAAAIAVANELVAAEPGVQAEVSFVAGRVVVRTETWAETSVISLIGISRLPAHGTAEAELVASR